MSISLCKIINFPTFKENRGSLSFLEGNNHVPFDIKRIYYISEVPKFSDRGNHAHKKLKQIFIAISGAFDIKLDDGNFSKVFHLNSKNKGLYICPMIWRRMYNFSSDCTCLVLASEKYHEDDYIWNYSDLKK